MFGDLRSVGHAARKPGKMRPAEPPSAEPAEPPAGPEPVMIDSMMFGEPETMAAYLLPGPKPALIDPGPANTADRLVKELHRIGVTELDSIVLTHIHFDHAAGASRLAEQFPGATVYVPERVAEHMIDPSRLIEGVRSVWGEKTDALFGRPGPIDRGRVIAIEDGDRVDLGGHELGAIATPGHTRAHLAYLDSETGALFCGDAIGTPTAVQPGDSSLDPTLGLLLRRRPRIDPATR